MKQQKHAAKSAKKAPDKVLMSSSVRYGYCFCSRTKNVLSDELKRDGKEEDEGIEREDELANASGDKVLLVICDVELGQLEEVTDSDTWEEMTAALLTLIDSLGFADDDGVDTIEI